MKFLSFSFHPNFFSILFLLFTFQEHSGFICKAFIDIDKKLLRKFLLPTPICDLCVCESSISFDFLLFFYKFIIMNRGGTCILMCVNSVSEKRKCQNGLTSPFLNPKKMKLCVPPTRNSSLRPNRGESEVKWYRKVDWWPKNGKTGVIIVNSP